MMGFTESNKNRIEDLLQRIRVIEKEKERLLKELRSLQSPPSPSTVYGSPLDRFPTRTPEERIRLFLRLFCCRTDVHPRMWENAGKGTRGFSPACRNEWVKGLCEKPAVKCGECSNRDFIHLDESVVRDHLEGRITIGSYAIRQDDTCIFLAADFDKSCWQLDVNGYRRAGSEMGVDVAVERSRSGRGAHAWIFFRAPIEARKARRLGTLILARAASNRYQLSLESHDRFFPNQDILPKGGFGNLIALPLQRIPRKKGNSVFVRDSFVPFEDQWDYLSKLRLLSAEEVETILGKNSFKPEHVGTADYADEEIAKAESSIDVVMKDLEGIYPEITAVILGAMISIDISSLPSKLITALKRTATFANPKFFELQRLRFSTWKTPRYIFCGELTENRLELPRGNLDEVIAILRKAGSKIILQDARVKSKAIDTKFTGQLMDVQESALAQIEKHDLGVLVAPPGSGKTVIACALIGKRKVRTLILVHRKQLADQWKSQLFKFLDLKKSQVGIFGGRIKSSGMIDIGMLQTVSRSPKHAPIRDYDLIIVDECHHVPAVSFENVLKNITARYFLGLTATPYRKDGHQAIIRFQCGPILHTMSEVSGQSELEKKVMVRETKFRMPEGFPEQPSIHEIWSHLVSDSGRLRLIAEDVAAILIEGRLPLILSERKDHLESLMENISEVLDGRLESKGFLLSGDIGKRERSRALTEIRELRNQGGFPFLLSTGSLIGEGFDMPELCTLVLAMPISFKGRIIQYAGRIHRESPGKTDAAIYDYVDIQLGLGRSMFRKRLLVYKKMGYAINYPDDSKTNEWFNKKATSPENKDLFNI